MKSIKSVKTSNLLVLHDKKSVVIYDIVRDEILKLEHAIMNIVSVDVSPVVPVIAIKYYDGLTLYNILKNADIFSLNMRKDFDNRMPYVKPYCFSPITSMFYVVHEGFIEVYDVSIPKLMKRYRMYHTPSQMICSPDDSFLAYIRVPHLRNGLVDYDYRDLVIFDLDTSNSDIILRGTVNNISFVDSSMLAYRNFTDPDEKIRLYDCFYKSKDNVKANLLAPNRPSTKGFVCKTYSSDQRIVVQNDANGTNGYYLKTVQSKKWNNQIGKDSGSCISHCGRYIYIVGGNKKCNVTMYDVVTGDRTTRVKSFEINSNKIDYDCDIINVCYKIPSKKK